MTRPFVCARIAGLAMITLAASLGCNSGSDSGGTGPPPPPPSDWASLISTTFFATAGASDQWGCTQLQVPADVYITGFRTIAGPGNYRAFLTLSDKKDPVNPLGHFNCNFLNKFERVVYASGLNTPDITFPAGVAVHLKAGQFLMLTVSSFDQADTNETGTTEVLVKTAKAADITQEADAVIAAQQQRVIPPDVTDYKVPGGCISPNDYHVFGLLPLMNPYALKQVLVIYDGANPGDTLENVAYSTAHQDYALLAAPFSEHAGNTIAETCTYDNPSGKTLQNGENVYSAICDAVMYRYPAPDSANSFDCPS